MAIHSLYVEKHGIGKRVLDARNALRLGREELADKVGFGKDTIRGIENERIQVWRPFHREKLEILAHELGVTVDYLLKGQTPETNLGGAIRAVRAGYRMVPIYGAISAGQTSYSSSDVLDWEEMVEWTGDFERWGRVITGRSMYDEFEEGDIAIFENRRAEVGHGVHAVTQGEDTFKVYRVVNGRAELWPINPEYEPIPMHDGQSWTAKGVCIRRIRRLAGGVRDIREYPHGFIYRFPA